MRVAVLTIDGRVVCCGPTLLALADAVRPLAFPARVDPSFWLQRAWMAEGLEHGFGYRGDDDVQTRRLHATWHDVQSISTPRTGVWTEAR